MPDRISDPGDGYDEILDGRTDEDEVRDYIAKLKKRYPTKFDLLKSFEFQAMRERFELIRGKLEATLILEKYI